MIDFIKDYVWIGIGFGSLYFIAVNAIYLLIIFTALHTLLKYKRKTKLESYKMVSILVPAFNEEKSIVSSVKNFINVDYPLKEVIVINDGSKDNTINELIENFNLTLSSKRIESPLISEEIRNIYENPQLNLLVIDKENGGKPSALNTGIVYAHKSDYFLAVDADSIITKDSLKICMAVFEENPKALAVSGFIRVLNDGFFPNFQKLEYVRDFGMGRVAQNTVGSTILISGAFGLFNRDAVLRVNGYNPHCVGEDLDLVLRLIFKAGKNRKDYPIIFLPEIMAYTEGPTDLKSIISQRRRWQRGLMEALSISKHLILNPDFGSVGMASTAYYFFIELLGPVVKIYFLILLIMGFYLDLVHPYAVFLVLVIAFLLKVFINLIVLFIDNLFFKKKNTLKDFLKMIFFCITENFFYKSVIDYATLLGFLDYLKKKKGWGKIKRKGF